MHRSVPLLAFLLSCTGDKAPTDVDTDRDGDTSAADTDGHTDTAVDTDTDADADADTDTDTDTDTVESVPSRAHVRDWGFAHWPTNHWTTWNNYLSVQHVHTGWYALAFDVSIGGLPHLGPVTTASTAEAARSSSNALVEGQPPAGMWMSVAQGGSSWRATGFLSREGAESNPSELVDMGPFAQVIEIPQVTYDGAPGHTGSLQLTSMPRHFVLSHRAQTPTAGPLAVRITMDGAAVTSFGQVDWLDGDRAVRVHDGAGNGWNFILPEVGGVTHRITRDGAGGLTFEASVPSATEGQELVLSLTAVPVQAADADQLGVWLDPAATVSVSSTHLLRDGTPASDPVPAAWDTERGAWVVSLKNISDAGGPGGPGAGFPDISNHTFYNRHDLDIENLTGSSLSVPLAFDGGGNASLYIVGGAPLLRDDNGEPTGIPLQISKNWHDGPHWYHLYAQPLLAPGAHALEHTFAHARWGETYAASHAQLSLVGWGRNQQWEESAVGAFGESITYDPDLTLGRAMVDDVRPMLVDANGQWTWTGNVGGASFLVYDPAGVAESRPDRSLERLRTHAVATGPNLTEVVFAGVSHDGRIEAEITTQLGRTDDLVRAWYHLEYTVLEEVTYDRFALFQVASDRYADNGFRQWAYGNAAGVIASDTINDHGTTGYVTGARGMAVTGEDPWILLFDSVHDSGNLPENLANVGFIVRDFEADLGGTTVTTPHISMMRTLNGGWSQVAFELGLPYDAAAPVIPAGSVIRATVEYVVPPASEAAYYGEAEHLLTMAPGAFQTSGMGTHLAAGGALTVEATTGSVLRTHPVVLDAAPGELAAEFTLTGGLGYVPVSVRGLARPDGWTLEQEVEGAWQAVDQSVEGNDFWQALDRGEDGFELTWNLPNEGTQQYRLRR